MANEMQNTQEAASGDRTGNTQKRRRPGMGGRRPASKGGKGISKEESPVAAAATADKGSADGPVPSRNSRPRYRRPSAQPKGDNVHPVDGESVGTEHRDDHDTSSSEAKKEATGRRGRQPARQPEQQMRQDSDKSAGASRNAGGRRPRQNAREAENDGVGSEEKSPAVSRRDGNKIRIIPLGGLNEIGKNMTVIEYGNDMIVVDCGMGFPDEDMPGIDLVIPDITYLENNRDRIRGIFLTHGHEDHIGAIPYVLRSINPPIYGTRLTLGIIRNKLQEHVLPWTPKLNEVKAGDVIKAGSMSVEFIHVNHSIADACALAIKTPLGMLIHTGDFKLDTSPIEGEMMDLARLGQLGNQGVLLLMCESTNAERTGYTPSERKVGESLEYIFSKYPEKRLVIATFSSNVHRVQQIIDTSARHGRKVAVTGRSMINIMGAAIELGYMNVPSGVLIDINDVKRYRPEELTIVTTGSQGEPMSALYRMAYSDHSQITLGTQDLVVLSSNPIPGNEKLVGRVINELTRNNITVLHEAALAVHVSGHACQEELKLMQGLTKPKYFMPVHGEYRHMAANRSLAMYMGMDSKNIFISDIGRVLEIDRRGARLTQETVPSGRVLVDGYGVGDVGNIVLRDRLHLSQDGLIVVVATLDEDEGELLSGPDIVSRGFVYVRESESLMDDARRMVSNAITDSLVPGQPLDRMALKKRIKDDLTRFLYAKTKRKPMILPVIMDV